MDVITYDGFEESGHLDVSNPEVKPNTIKMTQEAAAVDNQPS